TASRGEKRYPSTTLLSPRIQMENLPLCTFPEVSSMDFMAMKRSQLYSMANNPYSTPQQPGGGPYPPSQTYPSPPPHRYPMSMQGRGQMGMGGMQYPQQQPEGSISLRRVTLANSPSLDQNRAEQNGAVQREQYKTGEITTELDGKEKDQREQGRKAKRQDETERENTDAGMPRAILQDQDQGR
ncbi:hypothetical protein GBF38_022050, partial [Nibea albiflora]